jgi:hypothetical protein
MTRISCLTATILIGGVTAFAGPAYGQYVSTPVLEDTSSTVNNIAAGSNSNASDQGIQNTAFGLSALANVGCCAYYNTAFGYQAAVGSTTTAYNTAIGWSALWSTTGGSENTAIGASTLFWNTGNDNSAVGYAALEQNSSGSNNTAVGYESLGGNIEADTHQTGDNNTAIGANALYANTTGIDNVAAGSGALRSNRGGDGNTASGYQALHSNTSASDNTAYGSGSLRSNTTGDYNTASGFNTLHDSTTGSSNIGIGNRGGFNVTTGSNNIEIGNYGNDTDSDTTRIGTNQTAAYIAGIYGTQVNGGSAVYVTSSGQLGVHGSSERFKTHIAPMPDLSAKIARLRPVTFQYRTDAQGVLQYGLIAEEVDKVYPELVIRDDSGKIQGVRYEELAPMLLREVQKQQATIAAQAAQIRDLTQEQQRNITSQNEHAAAQEAEIRDLKELVGEMRAGLLKLQSKDELLAQR